MIRYVNKRNSYTLKHESSMRYAEFALEAKDLRTGSSRRNPVLKH